MNSVLEIKSWKILVGNCYIFESGDTPEHHKVWRPQLHSGFWIRQCLTVVSHTCHESVSCWACFSESSDTSPMWATPLLRHRDDIFNSCLLSLSLFCLIFLSCWHFPWKRHSSKLIFLSSGFQFSVKAVKWFFLNASYYMVWLKSTVGRKRCVI